MMLCSRCSEPITPVVAVDIDGTLGDYHTHFLDFAQSYFDLEPMPLMYRGQISFSEWWISNTNLTKKDWHDAKLAYRQGGMKRTMPIFDGAQALCWAVKDAGAELWLTTTRPYLSLDNIVPDTVEWCRRHDIDYDGMLFDELKYEEFSKRVDRHRVVAVLDDLEEMCVAAAKWLPRRIPILIKNPYNDMLHWQHKATLPEATNIIRERITEWRGQYD